MTTFSASRKALSVAATVSLAVSLAAAISSCASRTSTGTVNGAAAAPGIASVPSSAPTPTPPGPTATATVTITAGLAPGTFWASGMPPGQSALDAAAAKLTPILKGTYADWYAGLELQQPPGPDSKVQSALVIHRIPHAGLDDAIRAAAPGTTILFADTKYSLRDAQKVCDRVAADFPYWAAQGTHINTYGPYLDGRCMIGIDNPDKYRAVMEARYGADRINVHQEGQATPA